MTGARITHLGSDMRMKLKAAYTLIEQLFVDPYKPFALQFITSPAIADKRNY